MLCQASAAGGPASWLFSLLSNPEAVGIPPHCESRVLLLQEQSHCWPGPPTYPGEGPEALEDGSVARAAAQVSWGQGRKQVRGLWLLWACSVFPLLCLGHCPSSLYSCITSSGRLSTSPELD